MGKGTAPPPSSRGEGQLAGSLGPASLMLARMEVMSPPLEAGLTQRGSRQRGGMFSGQIEDKEGPGRAASAVRRRKGARDTEHSPLFWARPKKHTRPQERALPNNEQEWLQGPQASSPSPDSLGYKIVGRRDSYGKRHGEERETWALGVRSQQRRMALPPRSSQSRRETGTKAESPRLRVMGGRRRWAGGRETAGIWDQEGLHRGMMSESSYLCKDAKKKGEEKREISQTLHSCERAGPGQSWDKPWLSACLPVNLGDRQAHSGGPAAPGEGPKFVTSDRRCKRVHFCVQSYISLHAHSRSSALHTYPKACTEQKGNGLPRGFRNETSWSIPAFKTGASGEETAQFSPKPPFQQKGSFGPRCCSYRKRRECGRAGGCRLGRWITGLPA